MILKWLPVLNEAACTGCAICLEACGRDSLKIINKIVVFTKPELCESDEHCVDACPEKAIHMDWVEVAFEPTIGVWRSDNRSATPERT